MGSVEINVEVMGHQLEDSKKVNMPECWICLDEGIIVYNKKEEQSEYEHVAHCICEAGKKYAYDGRMCKDYKSDYYIPSIAEVTDPETVAKENLSDFYRRNKDNVEVIEELKRRLKGE
jgi:hypothetical protein